MDFFRNSFRGIFVFVVGLCMVCWPSAMVTLAVKVIGFCLIFAGLVTIVYNLANNGFSDLKGMSLVYLVSAVLHLCDQIAVRLVAPCGGDAVGAGHLRHEIAVCQTCVSETS